MLKATYRVVVLLCWVAAGLLLATNRRLSKEQLQLTSRLEASQRTRVLVEGVPVLPLRGVDRAGGMHVFDSEQLSKPLLVLVLSPTCSYTDLNWPNWDGLIRRHLDRGGTVVPVDISGDVDGPYLETHRISNLATLTHVTVLGQLSYRFQRTPQTIILQDGVVTAAWTGVLTQDDVARADALLDGTDPAEAPARGEG